MVSPRPLQPAGQRQRGRQGAPCGAIFSATFVLCFALPRTSESAAAAAARGPASRLLPQSREQYDSRYARRPTLAGLRRRVPFTILGAPSEDGAACQAGCWGAQTGCPVAARSVGVPRSNRPLARSCVSDGEDGLIPESEASPPGIIVVRTEDSVISCGRKRGCAACLADRFDRSVPHGARSPRPATATCRGACHRNERTGVASALPTVVGATYTRAHAQAEPGATRPCSVFIRACVVLRSLQGSPSRFNNRREAGRKKGRDHRNLPVTRQHRTPRTS